MGSDEVISLRDVLGVLKRRAWIVSVVVIVITTGAVGFAISQVPMYQASTELIVDPVRRTQDLSLEQFGNPQHQASAVETERLVITSRPVVDRVVEAVGGDPNALADQVRVEVIRDTRAVRVLALDPDPVRAAAISDAFARAYLDQRRDQAVEDLLAVRGNLDERAGALREQIAELDTRLEDDDLSTEEVGSLSVQREALLAQLSQITGQVAEFASPAGLVQGGGDILTEAEVPRRPVSPRPARSGALAGFLSLLLGVGAAFLRDHFDDGLRDDHDLKRILGGTPILGRIPHWSEGDDTDRLVTVVEPASVAGEAYRALSASVRFLLAAHSDGDLDRGRTILVTSSGAAEGKTSTAANLAVAAARVGHRVLLVDCDMRRPTVHKRFGLGSSQGLSDLLVSSRALSEFTVSVGVPNLLVVPAGTIPPNPAELLASPAMRALQAEAVRHADLVIYDSPPVLAVADALELARFTDVSILVSRAEHTGRRQLSAAVERLQGVGAEVAGGVFNDVRSKSDDYSYYYYEYTATPDPASRSKRRLFRGGARKPDTAQPAPQSAPTATSDRPPHAVATSSSVRVAEPRREPERVEDRPVREPDRVEDPPAREPDRVEDRPAPAPEQVEDRPAPAPEATPSPTPVAANGRPGDVAGPRGPAGSPIGTADHEAASPTQAQEAAREPGASEPARVAQRPPEPAPGHRHVVSAPGGQRDVQGPTRNGRRLADPEVGVTPPSVQRDDRPAEPSAPASGGAASSSPRPQADEVPSRQWVSASRPVGPEARPEAPRPADQGSETSRADELRLARQAEASGVGTREVYPTTDAPGRADLSAAADGQDPSDPEDDDLLFGNRY